MSQFCTQSDLERALGGSAVLVQLLDKNEDGTADADAVADILDLGSNEIASYLQVSVDLSSLVAPFARILVLKTADVCAFHAWSRGMLRQAVPPNIQTLYDSAIRWAQDVGLRKATLGTVVKATLDPPAEMIDYDPTGSGISIAGFKKGFR